VAHLWVEEARGRWAVLPLETQRFALGRGVMLRRYSSPGGRHEEWCVLSDPTTRIAVNGVPLTTGIRVLDDRDEITAPGRGSVFFSTERLARCEPLPPAERPLVCPRCRQPIAIGSPAVRCPRCALWHHQSAELPCWTYSPTCALCPQPTALDAGFRWTPEDL
jgi:hypothetical protein